MSNIFNYCKSLKQIDVSHFDITNVTDMTKTFNGCSSLNEINLSNFVIKNVTI